MSLHKVTTITRLSISPPIITTERDPRAVSILALCELVHSLTRILGSRSVANHENEEVLLTKSTIVNSVKPKFQNLENVSTPSSTTGTISPSLVQRRKGRCISSVHPQTIP